MPEKIHPGISNHAIYVQYRFLLFISASGGFYLLADSAQFPYNIIQTKSRQFPKTRGTRLTFYYFMYGQTVKELSVFIQYGKVSKEIWKASGNQGRKWNKADVVYYSPASYNVRI